MPLLAAIAFEGQLFMKRILLLTVIASLSISILALSACGRDGGSSVVITATSERSTPSPVASATSTPSPTPTPTETPTAVPSSTPTLKSHQRLRVDSFVCERFFPGIPNPDGPNEWLNISGTLTNVGDQNLKFANLEPPVIVEVLDLNGQAVVTMEPNLSVNVLVAGQLARFEADPINREHPSAVSCRVTFNLAEDGQNLEIHGENQVEVTIFAAP